MTEGGPESHGADGAALLSLSLPKETTLSQPHTTG